MRSSPTDRLAATALGHYFAELDRRFPGGFDPGDADYAGAVARAPPPAPSSWPPATGEPVACGGVQEIAPGTGEIKRMWVDPAWRGAGLGARMLRHLEEEARRLGHTTVRLDTNATLTEAVAMYERAGYLPTARYNDNPYAQAWFTKPL